MHWIPTCVGMTAILKQIYSLLKTLNNQKFSTLLELIEELMNFENKGLFDLKNGLFQNYFYNFENKTFYFWTGLRYRIIDLCYAKRNSIYISAYDIENKSR